VFHEILVDPSAEAGASGEGVKRLHCDTRLLRAADGVLCLHLDQLVATLKEMGTEQRAQTLQAFLGVAPTKSKDLQCDGRPTVGDITEIIGSATHPRYIGLKGQIITDEKDGQPYQLDGMDGYWCRESEVRRPKASLRLARALPREVPSAPIVALCAIGGLPLAATPQGSLEILGHTMQMDAVRQALRSSMSAAVVLSHLGVGDRTSAFERGNSQVAHFSLFVAGHGDIADVELSMNLDRVKLSHTDIAQEMAGRELDSDASATATMRMLVLSGSLEEFQALVSEIADETKDTDYRDLLWLLKSVLHALASDVFHHSEANAYQPSAALIQHAEACMAL